MTFPDVRSVNPLKARLQSGQTAAGTFLTISGPEVAEICGLSGCDFVIIDTEHTPHRLGKNCRDQPRRVTRWDLPDYQSWNNTT